MPNADHLKILEQGIDAWNGWRANEPSVTPDLVQANLFKADLRGANFFKADLRGANLCLAILIGANFSGANVGGANLAGANLSDARFAGANLRYASLIDADLTDAKLTDCRVYGISAWGLKLSSKTEQRNLLITRRSEPDITVDNIEVAQFVHLLLHNQKIRNTIDTIGRKGVLLLGRFTEGRIAILERLREELRKRDFLPLVFNFDKPDTKDFTDTIRILAGLSRFVIADITKPRSTPLELQATVPEYMVPFVPIIEQGEEPFSMFKDLWVKHRLWVLNPICYSSIEELIQGLDKGIVIPALDMFDELMKKRAEEMPIRRMRDIIAGT